MNIAKKQYKVIKRKKKIFKMLQQGEYDDSLQILLFSMIKMVNFIAAHSFKNVVFGLIHF